MHLDQLRLCCEFQDNLGAIEGDLFQNNTNNSRSQKIPAKVTPPQTKHKQAKSLSHGRREGEQLLLETRKGKEGCGMVI